MRKLYMTLWWLCAVQFPILFVFYFSKIGNLILDACTDVTLCYLLSGFLVYFLFSLVCFSPLTIILTLILLNKARLKKGISKLEVGLAVISCVFSLIAAYYFLVVMEGKLVG